MMRKKSRGSVTRRQLAEALGVHMMTVTKWERQGLPVAERGRRGKPSLYKLEDVQAWISARDETAAGKTGDLDPIQEKARRDHWQAVLAEQTYQVRRRELLPASEVEKIWGSEVAAIRAKLLALPVTFADRLHRAATLEGLAGVERVLQAAVRDVLRQLAAGPEAEDPPGAGAAA